MKNFFKRNSTPKRYNNLVEASYSSRKIMEISGVAMFVLKSTPGNQIVSKFSVLGFISFVIWYGIFFYCTIKANLEKQTILRTIYNTKLDRYGDDFEEIASIFYVLYGMVKIPIRISGNTRFMQEIVALDKALENLGEIMDYNKSSLYALLIAISQVLAFSSRMICIWASLHNLNVVVPTERLYQVVVTDISSLILSAYFCYYLVLLKDRWQRINKVLSEIQARKSWEYKLFIRSRMAPNVKKVEELQERQICEKIRLCAKIYSMLCKASKTLNKMFGFALVLTMVLYLLYIILYMFYFMEATASGLFHEVTKFVDFLIYVSWQMSHALGIIYINIYFVEETLNEVSPSYNLAFIFSLIY
uniref:Gustatory receptor n=1 Tax=Dendrolimus punctatus TaxID=238572 RepID=A0A2K8GL80_9NEOP|nr:antennal gustatory receptor 67 [Dendrolimus punctatus]